MIVTDCIGCGLQLIAGSGTTQERDEAENAPLDGSTSSAGASVSVGGGVESKDDGYQEGVPGPITRLFVIANRGIANLVQDLILVSCLNQSASECIDAWGGLPIYRRTEHVPLLFVLSLLCVLLWAHAVSFVCC